MKNRATAERLAIEVSIATAPICPECGEKGRHWVNGIDMLGFFARGFWICEKFYDPNTGRRLEP